MREIKFRGYCKKDTWGLRKPTMIYFEQDAEITDSYFTTGTKVFRTYDDYYAGYSISDVSYDFEIMQFTGLKDKNGKEIYEGDIILAKWNDKCGTCISSNNELLHPEYKGVVKWGEVGWEYGIKEIFHPINIMGYDIETLGNIYENPELLSPQ